MKQGIGFSVTINIIAIFIVVTFAFLVTTLNYYKAYKVNNAISDSIEKYEGYNALSKAEIERKLTSLGYVNGGGRCGQGNENDNPNFSYCIHEQDNKSKGKYRYKIVTFLNFNIPIINQTVNLPVNTYTNWIYQFAE